MVVMVIKNSGETSITGVRAEPFCQLNSQPCDGDQSCTATCICSETVKESYLYFLYQVAKHQLPTTVSRSSVPLSLVNQWFNLSN